MDNVNQDELILKQQEAIQKDIADNTKLVSDILPLQSLEAEFQSDEVFKSKILKLGQKYSRMRRVRPDGNCFFRAVGYRLFEVLIIEFLAPKGAQGVTYFGVKIPSAVFFLWLRQELKLSVCLAQIWSKHSIFFSFCLRSC